MLRKIYFPSRGKRKCDESCDESPPSKHDNYDFQSPPRKRRISVAKITPESNPDVQTQLSPARSLKCCPGWTGEKYHELLRQSFAECSHNIATNATLLIGFGIASSYTTRKSADELEFCLEEEMYVLRSKACTSDIGLGGIRQRLCKSCGLMSKTVSRLCNDAADKPKIHTELRLTKAMIRKSRDDKSRNMTKRETRLRALLALLDRGGSSKIAFEEDRQILRNLLETLSPFIEKKFGKGTDHAIIWQESTRQLLLEDGRAPKYNDVVLKYAISKLPKVSKTVYEEFRKLLFLPCRRYTQKLTQELVSGDEGLKGGVRQTI
jgi:hypothetical protein